MSRTVTVLDRGRRDVMAEGPREEDGVAADDDEASDIAVCDFGAPEPIFEVISVTEFLAANEDDA